MEGIKVVVRLQMRIDGSTLEPLHHNGQLITPFSVNRDFRVGEFASPHSMVSRRIPSSNLRFTLTVQKFEHPEEEK